MTSVEIYLMSKDAAWGALGKGLLNIGKGVGQTALSAGKLGAKGLAKAAPTVGRGLQAVGSAAVKHPGATAGVLGAGALAGGGVALGSMLANNAPTQKFNPYDPYNLYGGGGKKRYGG
jgi:hypothetical protein